MGNKVFGNPLTDLRIITAIPDVVTNRKGVNKIVGHFGKFNRNAVLKLATALEKQVSGPAFPVKQREAAVQHIRAAKIKQMR